MEQYTLNNGQKIPPIGFGTWEITPDSSAELMVGTALKAGYRLIDTAKIYGNEVGVGTALKKSGLERSSYCVTTKLWNDDQGFDNTIAACQRSLANLGLAYLDLYLIHWPATKRRQESWRAFERLYADGLIKAAGVSNYTVKHLEELLGHSQLIPAVNQVEFHPFIYEQQKPLLDFCRQHNILLEAYSPISLIAQEDNEIINAVSQEIGHSPQQVVLRWCLQHGTLPLPRSTNPEHVIDNFQIFDFSLNEAQMERLNGISNGKRVTWDPESMGSEQG